MSNFRKAAVGVVACLLTAGLFVPLPAYSQNTGDAGAIKAIDTDCSAIQNAVMALHPIHVALIKNTWKVLSDADYTVAEQTRASITLVDAWKQGTTYAWIHSHSFDAQGNQRATQTLLSASGRHPGARPPGSHDGGCRCRLGSGGLLRKRRDVDSESRRL